jgi:hypothetical protein
VAPFLTMYGAVEIIYLHHRCRLNCTSRPVQGAMARQESRNGGLNCMVLYQPCRRWPRTRGEGGGAAFPGGLQEPRGFAPLPVSALPTGLPRQYSCSCNAPAVRSMRMVISLCHGQVLPGLLPVLPIRSPAPLLQWLYHPLYPGVRTWRRLLGRGKK